MFNNLIVAYLFLGGMGAGACAMLSVLSIVLLRAGSPEPAVTLAFYVVIYASYAGLRVRKLAIDRNAIRKGMEDGC